MDQDLLDRGWSRDALHRHGELRRELDEATPSVGWAGLLIGAVILVMLAVVYFGPPQGSNTDMASRDTVEAPAPVTTPTNP
jgi:hypothetical protein